MSFVMRFQVKYFLVVNEQFTFKQHMTWSRK